MAAYTSTQAGDWNDVNTWGGGGYPSASGDTASIGHNVLYNVSSATDLSNVTVTSGGIFRVDLTQDTLLTFNTTGVFTVNSGGEDRVGTSDGVLPKAYSHAKHWPQGSPRNAYVHIDGGIINIHEDPDLYGSTRYAVLAATWPSTQTFYLVGDYSSKYVSGQRLWVHKYAAYSGYSTDAIIYTIDTVGPFSGGMTAITIVEAAPGLTFNEGATVINLASNIFYGDPASSEDVGGWSGYTEGPRMVIGQTSTNYDIDIRGGIFRGFDRVVWGGFNFKCADTVFLNNNIPILGTSQADIDAVIVSSAQALNSLVDSCLAGKLVSSWQAASGLRNVISRSEMISNGTVIIASNDVSVFSNIVSNGTVCTGNTDILVGSSKLELNTTIANIGGGQLKSLILDDCDVGGALRNYRAYLNSGDILPIQSGDGVWQSPPSGLDTIYQFAPNSNCDTDYAARMAFSPRADIVLDGIAAGEQTLTFKIYPVGFTSSLTEADIYIVASYLDSASGTSRTEVQTTTATFANGAWRSLSVTIDPAQEGQVFLNIYLTKYESGDYVLLDPGLTGYTFSIVNGVPTYSAGASVPYYGDNMSGGLVVL